MLAVFLLVLPAAAQITWSQCPVAGLDTSVRVIGISGDGLIAAGFQNQLALSDDNGGTWTVCSAWPGVTPSCIAFNADDDMFIGTYADGMYRSEDDGLSFTQVNSGLTSWNVRCMVILDNGDILLGTSGGIFRSADNGDNWASFGTGLPQDVVTALSKGEDNRVYAGFLLNRVYRSNDLGASWVPASINLPDTTVVTALFENPGWEVYAGVYPQGLFVSANFGNSWMTYNDGLPFSKGFASSQDYYIRDISLWSMAIVLMIYHYGVLTNDYFKARSPWQLQNTGFPPDPTISCLAVGPQNQLFAGTETQGLYKYIPAAGFPSREAEPLYLSSSPNPAGQNTTFCFRIPHGGSISLCLYDATGRLISTITDDRYNAGEHRIDWWCGRLESGLYTCRLKTSTACCFSRLVIVR